MWVLPFTHGGIGLNVLLIDRPIASEGDHYTAKDKSNPEAFGGDS